MVTWFAGIFYLPRLFVYHAECQDDVSKQRFKIMERRLYYGIATPGAVLTTVFGIWLLSYNVKAYMQMGWMHTKLSLVVILWVYHLYCGHFLNQFKNDNNRFNSTFYRWFNEFPVLLLIGIIILVVVQPF